MSLTALVNLEITATQADKFDLVHVRSVGVRDYVKISNHEVLRAERNFLRIYERRKKAKSKVGTTCDKQ